MTYANSSNSQSSQTHVATTPPTVCGITRTTHGGSAWGKEEINYKRFFSKFCDSGLTTDYMKFILQFAQNYSNCSNPTERELMFTLHSVRINLPHGKSLKLIPFGDVHYDSPLCDRARWRNFVRRCKHEDDPHTYYLLMGDPNEFASWNDRNILLNRGLHESAAEKLDKVALDDTMEFIEEIIFMKGKLLGVIAGNHKWVFKKRGGSDEMIADALGSKFLGDLCYIRLVIKQDGRTVNVDIVAHHGKAGGKTAGATINQVDDLRRIFPVADLYCCGHDHKRGAWPESVLIVQNNGIRGRMITKQKRQLLCRTGSFLRGYVDGTDSYVADRLLRPCELGTIRLEIKIKRDRSDGIDSTTADVHALV